MCQTKKGQLSPQRQRFLETFSKDIREDRRNGLAATADEVRQIIQREESFLLKLSNDEFARYEQEYFEMRADLRDVD